MRFKKPQETLPMVVDETLVVTKDVVVYESKVICRLIAVIPPKVSGRRGPVDEDDLGNNLDIYA